MTAARATGRSAVFLDRDGTLNRTFEVGGVPRPPDGPDALELLPGVAQAVDRLRRAGLVLIVVTNQPDVARGDTRREAVEAINAELRQRLPLDAIYCCYHDDPDGCDCRKPRPGMLISAAERFGLELSDSYLVGDRWKDVEAGRRVGCTTILLEASYSEAARSRPDHVVADLPAAVDLILTLLDGARV